MHRCPRTSRPQVTPGRPPATARNRQLTSSGVSRRFIFFNCELWWWMARDMGLAATQCLVRPSDAVDGAHSPPRTQGSQQTSPDLPDQDSHHATVGQARD